MAYKPKDLNLDDQQQQVSQPGGTGGMLSGVGSGTLGGTTTPQSATAPKPTQGSGWTNLQTYINKNQEAGKDLGAKIGGSIQGKANDVATSIDNAKSQASLNPASQRQAGIQQQSVTNTDFFRNIFGQGPVQNNLSLADQRSKAQAVADDVKRLDSEAGVSELLKQQQTRQKQGITALNNLFLQGDDARAQLANAKANVQGLNLEGRIDDAYNTVAGQVAEANSNIAANKAEARDYLAAQAQALRQQIQEQTKQAERQRQQELDSILSKMSVAATNRSPYFSSMGAINDSLGITDGELARVGMTRDDYERFASALRDNYASAKDSVRQFVTAQDLGGPVVFDDQAEKSRALAELAGLGGFDASGLYGEGRQAPEQLASFNLQAFLDSLPKANQSSGQNVVEAFKESPGVNEVGKFVKPIAQVGNYFARRNPLKGRF